MQIDFKLPSLGADMESAVFTQWLKNAGDAIHRGDAVAVVETAKGLIDIECFDDGKMIELVATPGTRLPVGAVLARIDYYLGHCVDFGAARDWLQHYNAAVPVAERLIEAVLIIKAVALAAHRVEGFSGYFRDQRFQPASAVHVGTAIALRGGGLVAPALLDAHSKDLKALMREFSDLVTRVRSGHMRSGEFTAATITVTSLGGDGADVLYPIINPPQVAIVGAGAIAERPWVIDGKLTVRPILELTVAGDHRVTDGRAGSRFVRTIAALLSDPQSLT